MKDDLLQIRISTEEKSNIKKMAKENGLTLTDFIVKKCNDKCSDTLCNDKRNDTDYDYVINLLTKQLKDVSSKLECSQNSVSSLSDENKKLRVQLDNIPIAEIGAFDDIGIFDKRPKINVFVDWIGYSMFIRNHETLEKDKERDMIYREIWSKHIKPMYEEFCLKFK